MRARVSKVASAAPGDQFQPTVAFGGDTTSWLADHEGLVGLVGEHDLDHTDHPDPQLGHTHPSTW